MKKVDIILTAATNLDGKVVKPSDKPVAVEKNLAAQLIANGRAKLPELPKSESDDADQDKAVAEAKKAARDRIEAAEKQAKEAEDKALKQIEEYEDQVAEAEKEAREKIIAAQKSVEEANKQSKGNASAQTDKKNQGA